DPAGVQVGQPLVAEVGELAVDRLRHRRRTGQPRRHRRRQEVLFEGDHAHRQRALASPGAGARRPTVIEPAARSTARTTSPQLPPGAIRMIATRRSPVIRVLQSCEFWSCCWSSKIRNEPISGPATVPRPPITVMMIMFVVKVRLNAE